MRSFEPTSRRGAFKVLFSLLSLVAASLPLHASPLLGRWQPPPLTPLFLSGGFFASHHSALSAPEPASSLRGLLLPQAPPMTQGPLASGLLPRHSRWLLSARTSNDEPLSAAAILPRFNEPGRTVSRPSRAFEPLRDPEHLSSTILFLTGSVMFLASFLLGMLSGPPPQPDLPPPGPGSAPLLPVIITSPCLPLPPRSPA